MFFFLLQQNTIYSFNSHRCCCGQSRTTHQTIPGIEAGTPADVWVPYKHTRSHPTDAYGTIEFQGGAHPTKAQVGIFVCICREKG